MQRCKILLKDVASSLDRAWHAKHGVSSRWAESGKQVFLWLIPYLEDWQLGSHVVRSRQSQTGSGRGCKRLTTTRLLGTKACDVGMEMVQHCPQATAVCDCRSEYKASKISTRVPGVHNTQGFVWHGGVLVACPGSSARAQLTRFAAIA